MRCYEKKGYTYGARHPLAVDIKNTALIVSTVEEMPQLKP